MSRQGRRETHPDKHAPGPHRTFLTVIARGGCVRHGDDIEKRWLRNWFAVHFERGSAPGGCGTRAARESSARTFFRITCSLAFSVRCNRRSAVMWLCAPEGGHVRLRLVVLRNATGDCDRSVYAVARQGTSGGRRAMARRRRTAKTCGALAFGGDKRSTSPQRGIAAESAYV